MTEWKSPDESFADWEAHVFGYGYGTGEPHVLASLKAFLEAVGRDDSARAYDYEALETACGGAPAWFLINALCRADIIEYGSSPRYGWLTAEGERLRDYVAAKRVDELVSVICERDDAPCAPDCCNCGPDGYVAGKKCENPFWKVR